MQSFFTELLYFYHPTTIPPNEILIGTLQNIFSCCGLAVDIAGLELTFLSEMKLSSLMNLGGVSDSGQENDVYKTGRRHVGVELMCRLCGCGYELKD